MLISGSSVLPGNPSEVRHGRRAVRDIARSRRGPDPATGEIRIDELPGGSYAAGGQVFTEAEFGAAGLISVSWRFGPAVG